MGKFLTRFNNRAEYEDFQNSSDFILPNVTYSRKNHRIYYTSRVNGNHSYNTFISADGLNIATDGPFRVKK